MAPDCRETKQIINKVNEAVSCLLYVSDDGVTAFHSSVYDWLTANGYEDHEYTVKVGDGKKRLWQLCEPVLEEIKATVSSGCDLKLTNEVKHALEFGLTYLVECNMVENFSWLVDMIIVHCISTVYPKSIYQTETPLEGDSSINIMSPLILKYDIGFHGMQQIGAFLTTSKYTASNAKDVIPFCYLDAVVYRSPEGCFTEDEKKTARQILAKVSSCKT